MDIYMLSNMLLFHKFFFLRLKLLMVISSSQYTEGSSRGLLGCDAM
jgi:hypothetical protein